MMDEVEEARKQINEALAKHGYEVIEGQNFSRSLVFKIRKVKKNNP